MGVDDSLFGPHSRAQVLQMALAELIGTGMLIFLGCMGTVVGMSHSPHPHLLVALAFGLAVMICIQVSEHLKVLHSIRHFNTFPLHSITNAMDKAFLE
jgi:aquaporin related protein